MTAALLCLAAGVLLWPDGRSLQRARVRRARPVRAVRPEGPRGWTGAVPVPLASAAVAAGLGAVVGTPLVAVLAAACGALAARAWIGRREGAREDARLLAMAEALGALAAELRSGRTPEAAAATARHVGGDQDVGRAVAAAVGAPGAAEPAAARAGPVGEAMGRLAAGVRLSRRTGASLSAVVSAVEDDLRARHRHRLELRSAVAAPRASAGLLAGLPVLGLAMGSGVGADPWHVLTRTGTGQVLLVLGVALEIAGMAWSRRLVGRALREARVEPVPR